MSDPERSLPAPRRAITRRWWFWTALVVAVVVVCAGVAAWQLGARVDAVRVELEEAQRLAGELKAEAAAFDVGAARETLAEVRIHTRRAVELTRDPLWAWGEVVPVVGKNLAVVRQLGGILDGVVDEVAAPLMGVAESIDPTSLAPKDGTIDVQPFVDAAPAVERARAGLAAAVEATVHIDADGTVSQVVSARARLVDALESVSPVTDTLGTLVPLLAPSLGVDAPRTYIVMFQNNAELRALGGTALSFAVITVDRGTIGFQETVPAAFQNFSASEPVIAVPDGTAELYRGTVGTFIANATARPSFTTAATTVQAMWIRDQGYPVDGIVSVDPVALGYVLRATGPIPIASGDVLTNDTVVPLLLNSVYQRFDSGNLVRDNRAQDAVYSAAVDATFNRLTAGPVDAPALVDALAQGWNERRILYWSAHADEQQRIDAAGSHGELPVSDATTDRVGIYFEDNVGAKLNFYLRQAVQLARASCRSDGLANYRVTASLSSALDPAAVATLSPSITGQYEREKVAAGTQRLAVYLYAPPGAVIAGATVDGVPQNLVAHHDTEYPVGLLSVSVAPATTVTVVYDLVAASAGSRDLEALITPAVTPTTVTAVPLDCATVADR